MAMTKSARYAFFQTASEEMIAASRVSVTRANEKLNFNRSSSNLVWTITLFVQLSVSSYIILRWCLVKTKFAKNRFLLYI